MDADVHPKLYCWSAAENIAQPLLTNVTLSAPTSLNLCSPTSLQLSAPAPGVAAGPWPLATAQAPAATPTATGCGYQPHCWHTRAAPSPHSVPMNEITCRNVPRGAARCREVPRGAARCREVPRGAARCRARRWLAAHQGAAGPTVARGTSRHLTAPRGTSICHSAGLSSSAVAMCEGLWDEACETQAACSACARALG
jgi:hypothetical protein